MSDNNQAESSDDEEMETLDNMVVEEAVHALEGVLMGGKVDLGWTEAERVVLRAARQLSASTSSNSTRIIKTDFNFWWSGPGECIHA